MCRLQGAALILRSAGGGINPVEFPESNVADAQEAASTLGLCPRCLPLNVQPQLTNPPFDMLEI